MTIKDVTEKYNISQDTLCYYERIKMIPEVTRTSSGIRNYQSAGLSIEVMIEYVKLFQQGDNTILAILEPLNNQIGILKLQKKKIKETMNNFWEHLIK